MEPAWSPASAGKGPAKISLCGSLPSLRFLFKFTAVDESLLRRHIRCLFDLALVTISKNTFVSAITSMSGQEDILDGLEVNLQRPRQIFPFLQPSNASS